MTNCSFNNVETFKVNEPAGALIKIITAVLPASLHTAAFKFKPKVSHCSFFLLRVQKYQVYSTSLVLSIY